MQNHLTDVAFFFSNRRRHTIFDCDLSSDLCSSDLVRRRRRHRFVPSRCVRPCASIHPSGTECLLLSGKQNEPPQRSPGPFLTRNSAPYANPSAHSEHRRLHSATLRKQLCSTYQIRGREPEHERTVRFVQTWAFPLR